MAVTRKFLSALGIEADKIDQIIEAHTEVTDALKEKYETCKTNADKLAETQKQLETVQKELNSVKQEKEKYESAHTELEKLKSDIESKELHTRKENAFAELLKENGYIDKGASKIVKYSGFTDGIELDENNRISGTDELLKKVETEWGEYKGNTPKTESIKVASPPANCGSDSGKKISRAGELYAQLYRNKYGDTKEE